MKKLKLSTIVIAVLFVMSVLAYAADYSWHQPNATQGSKIPWKTYFVSDNISFKAVGATYSTDLKNLTPTANRQIWLPDYTGNLPLVVAQTSTATVTGGDNRTITGTSITMPAGFFTDGHTLEYTFAGSRANSASPSTTWGLHIQGAGSRIFSLTAGDNATSDWTAKITMAAYDNSSQQKIYGCLYVNGKVPVCDYATATANGSVAITYRAEVSTTDTNGDNVTVGHSVIKYWKK